MTKTCSKCGISKPATTEFFCKKLSGLASRCKECISALRRQPEEKEKANKARRARRVANPLKYRAQDIERYRRKEAKRIRQIARQKMQRELNPEKYKQIDRAQYEKHRERYIKQASQWAKKNPERKREIAKGVSARQRLNPAFRLRQAISAYIYWCLKNNKNGASWETLLNFTLADLMMHLERQFTKGMSWDNYGEWHIDHIVPASAFKYETAQDEEFKACWALTNLRPMWASDNIRKRDKRVYLI